MNMTHQDVQTLRGIVVALMRHGTPDDPRQR
jgi:hypothetical protein